MEAEITYDFSNDTYADWRAQAEKELKGKSIEEALDWTDANGIVWQPYYDRTFVDENKTAIIQAAQRNTPGWQTIYRAKADENKPELSNRLRPLGYDYLLYPLNPANEGYCTLHPIQDSAEENQIVYVKSLENLQNEIDELREAVLCFLESVENTTFLLPLSRNYFVTIAKLRALRFLLRRVVSLKDKPVGFQIMGETKAADFDQTDPNLNLIKSTTMVMAGIIGGCDGLIFSEMGYETPEFSERIRVNISLLLQNEAYFASVADPLAGSYFIENLTLQMTEKAWDEVTKTAW